MTVLADKADDVPRTWRAMFIIATARDSGRALIPGNHWRAEVLSLDSSFSYHDSSTLSLILNSPFNRYDTLRRICRVDFLEALNARMIDLAI